MSLILPRRKLLLGAAAGLICAPAIVHAQVGPLPGTGPLPLYPGGAFNPISLVGTKGGFWRADIGVSVSGANVTAWADQSTNANNLTTVAGTPKWGSTLFNTSFAGVGFGSGSGTGVADSVNQSAVSLASTTMSGMFLVIIKSGNSGSRMGWAGAATGDDFTTPSFITGFMNTSLFGAVSSGNQGNGGSGFSVTEGIPLVLGVIFDGAHANIYLNFVAQGAATTFSATLGGASTQIGVGDSGALSGAATAQMILAYYLLTNRALSGGDLTNLKTWTNSNWGTSF